MLSDSDRAALENHRNVLARIAAAQDRYAKAQAEFDRVTASPAHAEDDELVRELEAALLDAEAELVAASCDFQ